MKSSANSTKIAVCGVLTALSVAAMVLTSFFGVMTYASPMLVGGLLIVPVKEYGTKTAFTMYAAVSLLGLMLAVGDRELALFYMLLFGHYPIVQPYINHLQQRPLRVIIKAAIFNGCSLLAMWLASVIFAIPLFESDSPIVVMVVFYFVVGNISFAFYDHALWDFFTLYDVKVRVFLRKFIKF